MEIGKGSINQMITMVDVVRLIWDITWRYDYGKG
jgi:hypothetical protein